MSDTLEIIVTVSLGDATDSISFPIARERWESMGQYEKKSLVDTAALGLIGWKIEVQE